MAVLCDHCAGINLQDLKTRLGYELQSTWGSLLLSSPKCSLCDLVAKSVKRSLQRNRAFKPSISENCGPVRLVCAGRSLAQQSGIRRCSDGPVIESLLWREVAILIGEKPEKERSFDVWGAQVVMVTTKGKCPSYVSLRNLTDRVKDSAAEAAGVQGIELNSRIALSKKNIAGISKLLQTCRQRHRDCSLGCLENLGTKYFKKYGTSGLPSRLIDVTMQDRSKIKLVSTKGRHEYIALSHCWGESQPLVTTAENLDRMQIGVKVHLLAKTVQDAVVLCRELNVRYLWVDALCIVQDGDGGVDWALESPKMTLIYAQSYATIAAASAKSSEESFLSVPRTKFVSAPFREKPQTLPNGELLFGETSHDFANHFEIATYESPLAKRAWVMQERIFSRRTIHFTARQIYWECRSLFWAENGEQTTTLASDNIKTAAKFMQSLLLLLQSDRKDNFMIYMLLTAWSELINDYSGLKLTYGKDRLPGVEGLARAASLVLPGSYLCGIWEHTLSNGLLWTPKERPMTLLKEKPAPSWSWASTIDAIRSGGVPNLLGGSKSRITLKEVLPSFDRPEILVLSGQIHSCAVSLEPEPQPAGRRAKDMDPYEDINDYSFWSSFLGESYIPPSGASNTCRFDGERGAQIEFFFFRLECSENLAFSHCCGLMLKQETEDATGQLFYTRIGIGWASDSVWHGSSSSIVQLK